MLEKENPPECGVREKGIPSVLAAHLVIVLQSKDASDKATCRRTPWVAYTPILAHLVIVLQSKATTGLCVIHFENSYALAIEVVVGCSPTCANF